MTSPHFESNRWPITFWLAWRRKLLRAFFRFVFHVLYRVKITGMDHVPKSGGYVIAHNHVSIIDPPLVASFWPVSPDAIGTEELWERKGQNLIVKIYKGIPVGRQRAMDRHFLQTLVNVLKEGRPLLLAPEGGRSHVIGMCRAEPGIAYLVEKADVPVVPVGAVGCVMESLRMALKGKRPTLELRIGEPFRLPPISSYDVSRREARQQNADLVMRKIAQLLPEAYHGAYHDTKDQTGASL